MAKQGFSRIVTSGDGHKYAMPPTEYNYVGEVNRDSVLSKAKAAAANVKRSFAVLVTESAGRSWERLAVA
jgi:hypothetical protein